MMINYNKKEMCGLAIIENQTTKIRWTNNNKDHFISKGYRFTKFRDLLHVKVDDLLPNSSALVEFICDNCFNKCTKEYFNLSSKNKHYCSIKCGVANRKKRESIKSEKESIDGLLKLFNRLKRVPKVSEYDNFARDNNLLMRRSLEKRLSMKWNDICKEYIGKANRISLTKDEFLNKLINIKNKLGRTPMVTELKEYDLNFKQIYRIFDMTYSELIKSLGWELTGHDVILKTDEELIEDYYKLFEKLNRIPSFADIDKEENMASSSTYKNRLGNMFDICDLCEIDYKKHIDKLNISSGFVMLDNNDELCLSYPEMIITNFFIENNVNYIKEYRYTNIIKEADARMKADWYIADREILIEYFGLFYPNKIDEDSRIGLYARRTLNKLSMCKENNIKLIDLYPEDLDDDLQGVKEKLNKFGILRSPH